MKAVIGETVYDVIERKHKVKVPVLVEGKPQYTHAYKADKTGTPQRVQVPVTKDGERTSTQLVNPLRQAQRAFERLHGISSSRQRRRCKTHRCRIDPVVVEAAA